MKVKATQRDLPKGKLTILVVAILAWPLAAQATQYQVTDLSTGADSAGIAPWSLSINNAGQVLARREFTLPGGQTYDRPALWNGSAWVQMPEIAGREGSDWSYSASRINNDGLVAGGSGLIANDSDPSVNGQYQGFIWNTKTNSVTLLNAPPYGGESALNSINGSGVAAGAIGTSGASGSNRAATWKDGNYVDLSGSLAAGNSSATVINQSGAVVGDIQYTGGTSAKFYLDGANASYLPIRPGMSLMEVNDMNDSGLVALWSDTGCADSGSNCAAGETMGTIWNPVTGEVVDFTSTTGWAQASGVNNFGQVVGQGDAPGWGYSGGLIWDAANGFRSLNLQLAPGSGFIVWSGTDINDTGTIAGYGAAPGEVTAHMLLLTPVPEPETYALMLAGLGLVGWIGRRRGKRTQCPQFPA